MTNITDKDKHGHLNTIIAKNNCSQCQQDKTDLGEGFTVKPLPKHEGENPCFKQFANAIWVLVLIYLIWAIFSQDLLNIIIKNFWPK